MNGSMVVQPFFRRNFKPFTRVLVTFTACETEYMCFLGSLCSLPRNKADCSAHTVFLEATATKSNAGIRKTRLSAILYKKPLTDVQNVEGHQLSNESYAE